MKKPKLKRIAALFLDDEKWIEFEKKHPKLSAYLGELEMKIVTHQKTSRKNDRSVTSDEKAIRETYYQERE